MSFRFLYPWLLTLLLILPLAYVLFRRFGTSSNRAVDTVRLVIRMTTLAGLVFTIAGPQISDNTDAVNLLYLVDVSDSAGIGSRDSALEYIVQSSAEKGPEDSVGIIAFARDAVPEMTPSIVPGQITLDSIVDSSSTDIEGALYRAVSMFSESAENRVALITDGNETRGDAVRAAQGLAAMGVQVFPVRIQTAAGDNEVLIQDIVAPKRVNAGEVHDLTVLIHSEDTTAGTLFIFRDGMYMGEDPVELQAGSTRFTYKSRIDDTGSHVYEFYLQPDEDTIQENNLYRASVMVSGEPVVLYVAGVDSGPSTLFLKALEAQGIGADTVGPADIPASLQEMLGYDAVIFDNVPAYDITLSAMDLVERYVKDSGGGLLMIGGDQSFGVGGYYATPVERALPVDMDVTSSMNIPSLALFMVVDKSGSMGDTIASGETKLDLVKEAVIASVEVLNPFYTVGLLAFDADYEWTVEPTNAGQRQQIIDDMSGLVAGGGTHLYPALEQAYAALQDTEAAVKHVLILSDGLTDEGDFEMLATAMRDDRITVSTVSVGGDSDRDLMSMIADVGGGRSYFTDDIRRIPRIFASESIIVSRGLIVEETFLPRPGSPSDITDGIDFQVVPPVHGFVLTYPKTGAQTILTAYNNNPLLSAWRYGLGRAAAYTSDFTGKWGKDLLQWEEFPVFAAQLTRWLRRQPGSGEFTTTIDTSGLLTVDAVDEAGNFINGLDLNAVVTTPAGTSADRTLDQVSPGRYELKVELGEAGDYFVTVYGESSTHTYAPETHIATVPYPREYLAFRPNSLLLDRIAKITGGQVLTAAAGERELFTRASSSTPLYKDMRTIFIVVFLALLLLDIASRQILKSRADEVESNELTFVERIKKATEARSSRRLTYDDLLTHLNEAKKREAEQRDMSYWFGRQRKTEDTTLRLYLSKFRK